MTRYIDAEKLCKDLMDMARYQPIDKQSTIVGIVSTIKHFSTADVVPRVEVEKLVQGVTRLVQEKEALIKNYSECMKDYAREVIEEIFLRIREEFSISELGKSALNQLEAELKNKYLEGEK